MSLVFKGKELEKLAKRTIKAKEFKIAYEDKYAKYPKDKKSFWMVKDEGIYLMPCVKKGEFFYESEGKISKPEIVYADGFDPSTNPDCFDDARYEVGGDDFATNLELTEKELLFLSIGGVLKVDFSRDHTTYTYEFKHTPKSRKYTKQGKVNWNE